MKSLVFAAGFSWLVMHSASAVSTLSEVTPEKVNTAASPFKIRARQLRGNTVAFRIEIKESLLSEGCSTSLSKVITTNHSEEIESIRPIEGKKGDGVFVYEFSVERTSLQDPDLSFVLTKPISGYPAATFYYFRLKRFVRT
jgi:hypothetical protein